MCLCVYPGLSDLSEQTVEPMLSVRVCLSVCVCVCVCMYVCVCVWTCVYPGLSLICRRTRWSPCYPCACAQHPAAPVGVSGAAAPAAGARQRAAPSARCPPTATRTRTHTHTCKYETRKRPHVNMHAQTGIPKSDTPKSDSGYEHQKS